MVIVEHVFQELFATVPTYPLDDEKGGQSFPLQFGFGEQKELNKILVSKRRKLTYPLLWYIMPNREDWHVQHVSSDFSFVLAMNTRLEWFNDQRYNETFRKYLFPYFALCQQAIKKASTVRLMRMDGGTLEYRVHKLPNYGTPTTFEGKDKTKQVDFWDALEFTFRAEITDNCLNHIKYNLKDIVK